jgi:hypothetical protein
VGGHRRPHPNTDERIEPSLLTRCGNCASSVIARVCALGRLQMRSEESAQLLEIERKSVMATSRSRTTLGRDERFR